MTYHPFSSTKLRDYWNAPSALDGYHHWWTSISTEDRDEFYINGSDDDEWLGLHNIYIDRANHTSKVASIFYDAEGGYDVLEYGGDQLRPLNVTVADYNFRGENYFLRFSGGYTWNSMWEGGSNGPVSECDGQRERLCQGRSGKKRSSQTRQMWLT